MLAAMSASTPNPIRNVSDTALWVATYPDEAPLVNGELEWIALGLADLD